MAEKTMDAHDVKLLNLLKENARYSIRELSQKTKMRPSTIHQRVQKLIQNKTIEKFTIQTSDVILGESLVIFFFVKGSTQKYLPQSILTDDRVKEIYGITGEYDILIKMKFGNVQEFNEFIIEFRKKHPQIQSTLTMVGTAKLKETT